MPQIYVLEEDNPWQGESPLGELLTKLEANPFVEFEQMELNFDDTKIQPYDRKKALTTLKRGKQPSVELRATKPFRAEAAISRGDWRNTVLWSMGNRQWPQVNTNYWFGYIYELAALFPKFLMAEIKFRSDGAALYQHYNLSYVPTCFGDTVDWYHLISPAGYEPYYTRAELLAAPAHCVRELDNGWIEIISYADPLAYDQPVARERIVAMTEYLNALRHDWQPKPLASAI